MSFRGMVTRARLELRCFLSPYPGVFVPLMRMRSAHEGNVIDDSTEIMIEGAPRSGNTFAVAAFEYAQGRPVSIARHLHGAGHVIEGIRQGLPVVVVCRNPKDSVASQVIRHPETTPSQALRQWITFHEPLVGYLDRFTVAGFDEITNDFGVVIDRVNERYGTDFAPFAHTAENVEAVFARVDEMDRHDKGRRATHPDATTARPVEWRNEMKDRLLEEMEASNMRDRLQHALELHEHFTSPDAQSEL